MKRIKAFFCGLGIGLCAGICLVILWLHRQMIFALLRGEELPEASGGCPFFGR